jgi:hypothetical protein
MLLLIEPLKTTFTQIKAYLLFNAAAECCHPLLFYEMAAFFDCVFSGLVCLAEKLEKKINV